MCEINVTLVGIETVVGGGGDWFDNSVGSPNKQPRTSILKTRDGSYTVFAGTVFVANNRSEPGPGDEDYK